MIDFLPLVTLFGFKSGSKKISFVGRDGLIDVECNSAEISRVLSFCNGRRTIAEVCKLCESIPAQLVQELLLELKNSGIVLDSREVFRNFHIDSAKRDAIMVTWYSRRKVSAIPRSLLPVSILEQVAFWESQGRNVKFVNLTLDSVPVVLAMIFSDKYPCFVSGAAAAYDFDSAIAKAFAEAQLMIVSWAKARKRKIEPSKIRGVTGHGAIYFCPSHLDELQWLLDSGEADPKDPEPIDLFRLFDPVAVDLTPEAKGDELKVSRVISEKLLPINFGYGSEHRGHPRLAALELKWQRKFPAFPHFFA